jgi:ribose-phosphate pyrophosphokinase
LDDLKVFTGNANPALAQGICDYMEMPLGKAEVFQFSNENIFVRILENVRECDVFVIQPISSPVNTSLMELLIMLDALERASAGRVTAVIPYYGYGRTDKKDQPRVPITARLIADMLTVAGADRILAVDLHAPQIQGFFTIPVDELTALYILGGYIHDKKLKDMVVVATDIGISKRARDIAERLDAPLAIIEKRRVGNEDKSETLNVIGDVKGMRALTVDDEIDTAGSLIQAVDALKKAGAKEVYA